MPFRLTIEQNRTTIVCVARRLVSWLPILLWRRRGRLLRLLLAYLLRWRLLLLLLLVVASGCLLALQLPLTVDAPVVWLSLSVSLVRAVLLWRLHRLWALRVRRYLTVTRGSLLRR